MIDEIEGVFKHRDLIVFHPFLANAVRSEILCVFVHCLVKTKRKMKLVIMSWLKKLFNGVYQDSLLQRDIKRLAGMSEEAVWHHVLNRSLSKEVGSDSLPLNLGRWAGGASFFFVLHRILQTTKPGYVLEMGLGESSKFISHHAAMEPSLKQHFIIEHDQNWIDNFEQNYVLDAKSNIEFYDIEDRVDQTDGINGLAYAAIREEHWLNVDLVVIDGPFGRGEFARSNVLALVPFLNGSRPFVLLFDDSQRPGETNTINELMQRLDQAGIKAHRAEYGGSKQCTVVCSEGHAWLKTL